MASQIAAPARATITPAAVRRRRAGNDGRRWLRSTSTQPDAHLGALGAQHRAVLVEGRGVTGEVVVSSSDHRAAQLVRVRDEGVQQPGGLREVIGGGDDLYVFGEPGPPGVLQSQGSEQDGACRAVSSGAGLRWAGGGSCAPGGRGGCL